MTILHSTVSKPPSQSLSSRLVGRQTEVLEGHEAMLVQYGCGEFCFWGCIVSCVGFERVQLWLQHPLLSHRVAPPRCVPTCGRDRILLCAQVSECFVHWNSMNEDYVVTWLSCDYNVWVWVSFLKHDTMWQWIPLCNSLWETNEYHYLPILLGCCTTESFTSISTRSTTSGQPRSPSLVCTHTRWNTSCPTSSLSTWAVSSWGPTSLWCGSGTPWLCSTPRTHTRGTTSPSCRLQRHMTSTTSGKQLWLVYFVW